MTSLKKIFLVGLLLVVIAVATMRFGYVTMLAMLIGTILLVFYYNERNTRWETLGRPTQREQSFIDEFRRRARKEPPFSD
jgi:hypothetical protein